MKTYTLLGFLCGATLVCLLAAGPEILAVAWKVTVDQRLDKLEAQVAILKRPNPRAAKPDQRQPARRPDAEPAEPVTPLTLIPVRLTNKRFQAQDWQNGVYEDALWFDVEYKPTRAMGKSTRAVKGALEFADLFGEVKFRLHVTINKSMRPGRPLATTGVGFEYNQFRDSHEWMRGTSFDDMKIAFRVESIIYQDGTTQNFTE